MNSAVRNGPIRTVETNTPSIPIVTKMLRPITAAQPMIVDGGCQSRVINEAADNRAVDEIREYSVIASGLTPCILARVIRSMSTRQHAATIAAMTPAGTRTRGSRAKHQTKSEKSHHSREHSSPAQSFQSNNSGRDAGQQRIDEIREDSERNAD